MPYWSGRLGIFSGEKFRLKISTKASNFWCQDEIKDNVVPPLKRQASRDRVRGVCPLHAADDGGGSLCAVASMHTVATNARFTFIQEVKQALHYKCSNLCLFAPRLDFTQIRRTRYCLDQTSGTGINPCGVLSSQKITMGYSGMSQIAQNHLWGLWPINPR